MPAENCKTRTTGVELVVIIRITCPVASETWLTAFTFFILQTEQISTSMDIDYQRRVSKNVSRLKFSRACSPFFRGLPSGIGKDLITDSSQDTGRGLCSQNKGLDHCSRDLTQDTANSPSYSLLFVFFFSDLNNVCGCLTQSLKTKEPVF